MKVYTGVYHVDGDIDSSMSQACNAVEHGSDGVVIGFWYEHPRVALKLYQKLCRKLGEQAFIGIDTSRLGTREMAHRLHGALTLGYLDRAPDAFLTKTADESELSRAPNVRALLGGVGVQATLVYAGIALTGSSYHCVTKSEQGLRAFELRNLVDRFVVSGFLSTDRPDKDNIEEIMKNSYGRKVALLHSGPLENLAEYSGYADELLVYPLSKEHMPSMESLRDTIEEAHAVS